MTNNDILRRLRFTFDFNDGQVMEIFKLGGLPVSRAIMSDWLKKEDDEAYRFLEDKELAIFLNGFIVVNRGRKDGPQPEPEEVLSNNNILRKLKIALSLRSDQIIAVFKLVNVKMSEHELSAFLRNPKQQQYRRLNDQFLRNFIHGLQLKYRPVA